jgi:hypothetical protein
MNMISTGSFLTETGASNKQSELVKKLTAAWEKKNSKTARAGGASLMALSLAACGGEDNTPFSQADVDAAKAEGIASVDITSDNAEAMTSNDAEIAAAAKTEALTSADGTIYATVDAAYTAGSNLSNSDAVTAALTGADGTVYATVDAAVTAGADSVDITTDNQAAIDAEMAGTGFASVAELLSAYNDAIAVTPSVTKALTTDDDVESGTVGNDAWTGTNSTYEATDVIVDVSTSDSDTLTVSATDDVSAQATVANVETVTFSLNAATTTATIGGDTIAASFQVDVANITGADKIVLDVTTPGSVVTDGEVYNVKSTTVESDLELTVNAVANADIVINATKATSQTIDAVTGTLDTLTVNGSAATLLTITDADAEEAVTVTNAGGVTITNLSGATTTAATTLDVTAGGAVDITSSNKGSITATTSSGNIILTDGDAATANVTLTAEAGNVKVTTADTSTGTLTVTASGDITNTSAGTNGVAGDDGDILITSADSFTSVVLTATGGADTADVAAATSLTVTAGEESDLAGTAAVSTLTLASNNASGTTFISTTGGTNLNAVNNIVFTGSNDVTLTVDATDLEAAAADTSGSTSAAAVIATDNSTATSRINIVESMAALTNSTSLDLSSLAVDEIAFGADNNIGTGESYTIANGATVVIASDQTRLDLTAAAVAGNTATVVVEDDSTASDSTAHAITALNTTNIANLTLQLDDTELDLDDKGGATGVAINVGATNILTITGAGDATLDAVTAVSLNASASTGNISINIDKDEVLAVTTGSGNDTFTDTDTAAAFVLDGGDGVDTFVAGNTDYKAVALSLTNIESIDLTAGAATVSATTGSGQTMIIKGGNTLTIADTAGTGATITAANYSVASGGLTLTGGAGKDILTASSVSATQIDGAGDNDTINGGGAGDTLNGDAGNDTISGGGGDDIITGGTGTDTLTGGAGDDDFFMSTLATNGADTITDFTTGEDQVDVDGTGTAYTQGGDTGGATGTVMFSASSTSKVATVTTGFADNATYETSNGMIRITDEAAADWSDVGTVVGAALTLDGTAGNNALLGIIVDNGTDTRIYDFQDTNNGFLASDDLTLVATLTGVEVGDLAVADFIMV